MRCLCQFNFFFFFLNKRCSLTPPPPQKNNHLSITVASPLLQHNYTGEHTRRLFAVTQCCPEAFLLPSPCQFCKWEERPRLCNGQITDDATVELDAALYGEKKEEWANRIFKNTWAAKLSSKANLSQIVHEGGIFHAVLSCCCSNPWDPELMNQGDNTQDQLYWSKLISNLTHTRQSAAILNPKRGSEQHPVILQSSAGKCTAVASPSQRTPPNTLQKLLRNSSMIRTKSPKCWPDFKFSQFNQNKSAAWSRTEVLE